MAATKAVQTVKIVAYTATEFEDLYDVTLKTTRRPYKTYVARLSVDIIGNPPMVGLEVPFDVSAKAPETHHPKPDPISVGTKVLRELHRTKVEKHIFKLQPSQVNGIACPQCGTEMIDGPKEACRQTLDGLMAVVICPTCNYNDNRIVKGN